VTGLIIFACVACVFFCVWLLMPVAAKKTPLPKRDENAPCPVCGGSRGMLRAIENKGATKEAPALLCQHSCEICGARWHETPVVNKLTVEQAWPAAVDFRNNLTNVTPLRRKA
jgi:hypothetical protein